MIKEEFKYFDDELELRGFVARPTNKSLLPVVLIAHDWAGCHEAMHARAEYFARLGYIGFAIDLYGNGRRGSDSNIELNQQLMGELSSAPIQIISRMRAAVAAVSRIEGANSSKIIALGFCLGGMCVLDYARSNPAVAGIISIHGILRSSFASNDRRIIERRSSGQTVAEERRHNIDRRAKTIDAKVLVLHGALDKMVDSQQLLDFQAEMQERQADWQLHVFGKAHHAFTNPQANNLELGIQYNAEADSITWELVQAFCERVFSS